MTRMNPRQEPAELLAHSLAAGRQWIVAIAASVSARDRPRGHSLRSFSAIWALHLAEQRVSSIALPPV